MDKKKIRARDIIHEMALRDVNKSFDEIVEEINKAQEHNI